MARKEKGPAAAPKPPAAKLPVFWLPAILLLFLPVYEMIRSFSVHEFATYAFWPHHAALQGLSALCFITAAVAAVLPPFRQLVARHLDGLSTAPRRTHLAWLAAAYVGFFAWFWFIRYCQYRSFQLPQDTAITVSEAHNFLRHGSLYLSIFGVHQLSIHFFLLMQIFSPILLVWNSPLAMLFMQNLFVCSIPFAAYGLCWLLTSSSLAGFAGMWLAMSTPYTFELLTSNLHNPSLAAFLPWAMFFLYLRKYWVSALFFLLMIPCVEQVPFIFFGLGLYAVFALREKKPWNWAAGLGICAAAASLFLAEYALIKHYQSLEGTKEFAGSTYWLLFKYLVPEGTAYERILPEILGHPLRTAGFAFSSIYRFYPLLRVLFSMGFLGLLNPAAMLPFAAAILPQVLASPPAPVLFFDYHPITYFDFGLHHPSYMFGPLIFGTAWGIERAFRLLSAKGRQSWLLVWVLAVSGLGFKYAHRTLMPSWRPWFDSLPAVEAKIPPGARLWVDEYASVPVSVRRWIKITQWGPTAPMGYHKLFKPDYVLIDKAFLFQCKPPYRDQMLTYFARNDFKKIAEDGGVFLLKSPAPSADPEGEITEWFELPAADPKAALGFGRYILNGPVSAG